MSQQQRASLEQLLRDAPLDLGGEVAEQRIIFEEMMAAIPVLADVTTSSATLGGIPVVNVEAADCSTAASPRPRSQSQSQSLVSPRGRA